MFNLLHNYLELNLSKLTVICGWNKWLMESLRKNPSLFSFISDWECALSIISLQSATTARCSTCLTAPSWFSLKKPSNSAGSLRRNWPPTCSNIPNSCGCTKQSKVVGCLTDLQMFFYCFKMTKFWNFSIGKVFLHCIL